MIVISLGGSVFVQDVIKTDFIRGFIDMLRGYAGKHRFIVVVGGGKVCRLYQEAARSLGVHDTEELDKIGIRVTQVNAELFRSLLGKDAYKDIVTNPTRKVNTTKILVASGWKPGCSTDHDAVLLAKSFGAKTIINVTNTDYVYDKDPREHTDARPLTKMTWSELQQVVGSEWTPGLNKPFDPVATTLAAQLGLCLIVTGPDLKNLRAIIEGKPFAGTRIG